MTSRVTLTALTLVFAGFILLVSIFRASGSVKSLMGNIPNSFSQVEVNTPDFEIGYELPEHVGVLPNSLAWPLIVLGDKLEIAFAASSSDRALVMLSHSDNRLVAGKKLADNGKYEDSIVVLRKAEDYLLMSYATAKIDQSKTSRDLVHQISLASLKHRQVLEEIIAQMPDEGRPMIVRQIDKTKTIYNEAKVALELFGDHAPQNPFEDRI